MVIVQSYFVAVLMCVITMLCWGSWANTQKMASKKWAFQLFYWDYSLGVLILALILNTKSLAFKPMYRILLILPWAVPNYITALIEGPVEEPRVTLSSSPPLPGDELMIMLLTGQPPANENRSTTGGVPMNLAVYIGQDLMSQWFDGDSTESWASILDRFRVTMGRRVTRSGEETLEAEFRIGKDVLKDVDSIYITGEKDVFDFYNAGLKFVFRFQ